MQAVFLRIFGLQFALFLQAGLLEQFLALVGAASTMAGMLWLDEQSVLTVATFMKLYLLIILFGFHPVHRRLAQRTERAFV